MSDNSQRSIPKIDVSSLAGLPRGVPGLSGRDLPSQTRNDFHKRTIGFTSRMETLNSPETDIVAHRWEGSLVPTDKENKEKMFEDLKLRGECNDWSSTHVKDYKNRDSENKSLNGGDTLQQTPRWISLDNFVLRFFIYTVENISFGPQDKDRVRKLVLLYYIVSDEMQINEPKQLNSGIVQGSFLKKVPAGRYGVAVKNIIVGGELKFLGRTFTVWDCDKRTREYFKDQMSIIQPPKITVPDGSEQIETSRSIRTGRTLTREQADFNDSLAGRFYGDFQRYLKFGNKALRFLAVWSDPSLGSNLKEERFFTISYYLCDDTIDIRERLKANSGRGPFTSFLKRSRPLKPSDEHDEDEVKIDVPFHWKDFICGQSVFINKRDFFLISCDKETKEFYSSNNLQQEDQEKLKQYKNGLLNHNAISARREEDEKRRSEHQRKALRKMKEFGSQALKLRLKMISNVPEDDGRELVLAFFLADEQLALFEPRIINSGILGGKFLERGTYINEETGKNFTEKDFKVLIGSNEKKVLRVMKHKFEVVFVSAFTQEYLDINFKNPTRTLTVSLRQVAQKLRGFIHETKFDFRTIFYECDKNFTRTLSLQDFNKCIQSLKEKGLKLKLEEIDLLKMKFCSHTRFYYVEFCEALTKQINLLGFDDHHLTRIAATNYGNTSQVEQLLNTKLRNEGNSLRILFRKFDRDKSGTLTFTEFQSLLRHYNLDLTLDQVAEIMSKYDTDQQGTIDYSEFCDRIESNQAQNAISSTIRSKASLSLNDFNLSSVGDSSEHHSSYLNAVQDQETKFNETHYNEKLMARFFSLCASKKTELRQVFRQIDDSKDGRISMDEFQHALKIFSEFTEQDQKIIIATFFKGQQELSYEQFMETISVAGS